MRLKTILHSGREQARGGNNRMVNCIVIAKPTVEQSRVIADLYCAQGWRLTSDDDSPQWIRKLVAGSHCFVVAMEGEEIVGMGRAISDGISDAYIQDLTVRSNRRNQGIGGRILRTILERLHADGLRWIGLIAEPGSSNLYRHAGFREMPAAVPMLMIRES
jgi:ribosomal protein S18 acetylase RimI-like enzyme